MTVTLPYNLREGQVAYAAKVMANFRALLGAYANISVDGLGEGDTATLLQLLYQAMVKADQEGNAGQIRFADGDTLEAKFAAGNLNASLLDSEGLFYFYVDPTDGHLYVTAAEGMEANDFEIDANTGHLIYTLRDPDDSDTVHVYDLGRVKGDQGAPGAGGMNAAAYDPNGVGKDLNTYTGYFVCYAAKWGGYYQTRDIIPATGKTYYLYNTSTDTYTVFHFGDFAQWATAINQGLIYEKAGPNEYMLTDNDHVGGATLTGHITDHSGHALLGPALSASDDGTAAWSEGQIRATAQGNGSITLKALGAIPTEDVDLQLTMFV